MRWVLLVLVITFLAAYIAGFDRGLLPLEARSADRYLLTLGSWLGVALIAADGLRNRKDVDRIIGALVGLSAFSAALGTLQFYGLDLSPYIQIPGLVYNRELVGLGLRGGPGFSRVYGTQQHYIEFGVVLAMVLPLAIHRAITATTTRSIRRRWIIVGILAAAVPFSVSRAGFLGLTIAFVALCSVWPRAFRMKAILVAVMALGLFRVINPGVLGTIRSAFLNYGNDPSIINRRADYAATSSYITDRPWFGRGLGSYVPEIYRVLDNQFLSSLLDVGLVGTVALTAVYLGTYALGRVVRKNATRTDDAHLGQALAASALVALVTSLTFDALAFPTFAGLLFLLFGLSGALWRIALMSPRVPSDRQEPLVAPAWKVLDDGLRKTE
ncbi:O-antigen ligase family protein [Blastococcus aurantiacus]|uniref:O-antigen ligase family protein n=1 Tax=Blastococcus aurantiacus TaxID=1550231 RepID=UPI0015A1B159|nr:O-antigen ligase family protein [Blastococcus aurantiacus]